MTANAFRKLALSFPETEELSHMDHPDFRVGGKIFASLGKGEEWGMVKLKPDQQAVFVASEPQAFQPFAGAWGRQGCTKVILKEAGTASVRQALDMAWRNTVPKKLLTETDGA